ncbi:hypothetical protein AVEN_109691-1 [Araneus ventricosus]|uniref:Reverse transcriptase/retrotransposon-derived protein RNase H-like domain-containing protein n=1 Tax=Araneus ventricosus TaxID=182803 RepID=A0A4Y2MCC7_ARAVE|nr:hypothetical protein AVEN_109691-1 [Araneus ventricosus]
MVNYYHRFIPNIATISSPLNRLLVGAKKRDKREIQWNIKTEKSFQDIKDAMAKATLLYHPSLDAKLALVTDCSDFAIGRVLQEISSDVLNLLVSFLRNSRLPNVNIQFMTESYWQHTVPYSILVPYWKLAFLPCM